MTPEHLLQLTQIREALSAVVRGKRETIDLVLAAMLAGGHVLLEDVPGVGKTTLAKALAATMGLQFARVQFTPDLLPSDVLGMNVLNPRDGTFAFHEGPVFHQLLLADEINRASPRTQSALLEAMNEGQVTLDGATRPLPKPFFVVATQNPSDFQGTYPLPEAQLDRFLLRVSLGYPDAAEELQILFDRRLHDPLDALKPIADAATLSDMQNRVRHITMAEDLGRYILNLVSATREHRELSLGASPRAALALFRAAQAAAYMDGREWATPGDVQKIVEPVLVHRLSMTTQARYGGRSTADIIAQVIDETKVPL